MPGGPLEHQTARTPCRESRMGQLRRWPQLRGRARARPRHTVSQDAAASDGLRFLRFQPLAYFRVAVAVDLITRRVLALSAWSAWF